VWPMFVVVRHIAHQHRLQLPSAKNQHPVGQLTTDGADPPFRERPRRKHRRPQDPDALGAEDGIEAVGELRVAVPDENLNLPMRSPRSMRRLRACWVTQAPVGLAVTPRMWTRRLATSITNSTYRRLSSTVSTWKRSHARMPWPVRPGTAARSALRGAAQDRRSPS
jgi:hypothetical protein